MQQMIRLLLVEDHKIVRDGLKSLLQTDSSIKISGEATTGKEAIEFLKNEEVDVVLTDLNLPEVSGQELIAHVKKTYPNSKVLVLSMMDNISYVKQAFYNGASAYLIKNSSGTELLFAIKHVHAGGQYLCSDIALRLLDKNDTLVIPESSRDIALSKREMEVLQLIGQGLTNNEIATKLFTSRRTVEGHRKNLLEKTGCKNTAVLIRYAVKKGLLSS